MLRTVVLDTPEMRERGLQHAARVEPGTLWVFPSVREGDLFHSRNVPEPFDLAFLSVDRVVLSVGTVRPPSGTAAAPPRTALAVEARAGLLHSLGYAPGARIHI